MAKRSTKQTDNAPWVLPWKGEVQFQRAPSPGAAREGDPRIGNLLGSKVSARSRPIVAIIGFPTDQGVIRNGGRAGAAAGPDALRGALYRMTPDPERFEQFQNLLTSSVDLGDLVLSGDLERDQRSLAGVITALLQLGTIPIILGGGHETAYGHFLGYVGAQRGISILNWDAHPDVRPLLDGKGHSGSPFRQALTHESGLCKSYRVNALQQQSASKEHLDLIRKHGGSYLFADRLDAGTIENIYARIESPHLVSFDLDALDQCDAPGVSAPSVGGLKLPLWLIAAERAGRCRSVQSIDIVEMNPNYDRDGATARVGALTVWRFMRGVLSRAG